MKVSWGRQAAIALGLVLAVFYVRLTWLPGASPYELFLFLDIAVAFFLAPRGLMAAVLGGLAAAHALIWLEAGRFGSARYWRLTLAYLVLSGLLIAFNRIGHRLSARFRREQRLKEEIVESSLDGIVSLDSNGRFVGFNRAAAAMFGFSRGEVSGRRMIDLIIAPDMRAALEEVFRGAASSGGSLLNRQLETVGVRKDGSRFPIELGLVRVDLKEEVFFCAHVRDITQRKEHEQERERLLASAEKANNVKDDLLANLSHEFRTPLNAILGWSTMMRRRQVPPDRMTHAAEVIERNAQAQSRLVDDLLDTSLAVAGLLRLHMSIVDVAAAVRNACDSVRPAAAAANVTIDCPANGSIGSIHVDAARFHQILLNLLSNAIKFTPAGGTITLDAVADSGIITTRVRDTGVGISAEFLPFVFEKFRQADTSTTRNYGGLGLGLAVVKHLVGVMGGEINAESDGPGRGATFSVRFPAHEGGADEAAGRQLAAPPAAS
jgi:PAS domain S-box-containing protein